MMGLYPSLILVVVLTASLLAALWVFFRRKRRRNEFPAETWDPYLDSGARYSPEGAGEGIEMISEASEDVRKTGISPADESVFSRLQDLEKFPPEMREEKITDDSGEGEEAPFGLAAEAPEPSPGSESSIEAAPPYSPDEPEEHEEREPVAETYGGGGDLSSLPPEEMESENKEEAAAGQVEGKSPWWKDAVAPKDRPFRRGVAELMGVTVLDSVASLETLGTESPPESVETEKPETEAEEKLVGSDEGWPGDVSPEAGAAVSEDEPVDSQEVAEEPETLLEPENAKVTAPPAASETEEAFDPESGEDIPEEGDAILTPPPEEVLAPVDLGEADEQESPKEAFVLDAEEGLGGGAEGTSLVSEEDSRPFDLEEDTFVAEEESSAGRPEESVEEIGGSLEVGEDVFSVIGEERAGASRELSEESIGNAGLFEDLEGEESAASAGEAASLETEEVVSLEGIVDEALSSEPMDIAPSAPSEAEKAGSHGEREPDAGGVPSIEEEPDEEAVPLPSGPPLEVVRELVTALCPNDLLLIEEIPDRVPDGAAEVAVSAWRELRDQLDERKAVDPEEFLRLGILDQFLGRYEEAMTRFKEALRRTDRMGPVLNAMAVASYLRGKIDPAISYCKEAVREAGSDTILSAAVHRNLGFLHQQRGDVRQAAEAIVASIRYAGTEEESKVLGELHLRAGQLFRKLGEMDNAQQHYSESAEFFGRSGDEMFRVRSLVALAASQTEQDDVNSALKNLDEAARLCERSGDKTGEALTLGQMGIAYSAQDQYTRAIEHFERALALNRELGNRRGEGANLSNIGNIHYFRGDLAEAQSAYEMALEINREQEHLIGQATILGNLGRIHLEEGEVDVARERLRESLDIFRTAGAKSQSAFTKCWKSWNAAGIYEEPDGS